MHAQPTRLTRSAALFALLGLLALAAALPRGEMAPAGRMVGDEFVHDEGGMLLRGLANAAGTIAVALTLASLWMPYLKRAPMRRWHTRIGVAILALAALHTAMFVVEGSSRGWIPGALSLGAFAAHGLTGALKVRLLRAWGAGWWRLAHHGTAWAALALVAEHILLASWHWGLARWLEGHE